MSARDESTREFQKIPAIKSGKFDAKSTAEWRRTPVAPDSNRRR